VCTENDPRIIVLMESDDGWVAYHIYPLDGVTNMESLMPEIQKHVFEMTQSYIFNGDLFSLASNGLELFGRMKTYGSILDEWCIVYALMGVTELFQTIAVRIYDCDGEFLLIEGADGLPRWITPDITTDRVFVVNGHVHVPHPDQVDGSATINECLSFLARNLESCRLPACSQAAIRKRYIRQFPEPAIRESKHRSSCMVGSRYRKIIRHFPRVVPLAVHALACAPRGTELRSKIGLKLDNSETVSTSICFTRFSFAQLLNQHILVPDAVVQNYPAEIAEKLLAAKTSIPENNKMKSYILGIRLMIGIDLLYMGPLHDEITAILNSEEEEEGEQGESDSDSWLNLSPNDLEDLLSNHADTNTVNEKLNSMATTVNTFMTAESDISGVEVVTKSTAIHLDVDNLLSFLARGPESDDEEDDDESAQEYDDQDALLSEAIAELMEEELAEDLQCHVKGSSDQPFNLDLNLVRNLLESYGAQSGDPGPVSNLLGELGLNSAT